MPKILIIGSSGMLGNALLRYFTESDGYYATGTTRTYESAQLLPTHLQNNVIPEIDVENVDQLHEVFVKVQPDLVVNCVGIVKQLTSSMNPLVALPLNSLFPHRLAQLCAVSNARLIHISTDCVFSGTKGMYTENDTPDAQDLYGVSKRLGEVDYPNAITLRTSIIGHELNGNRSLINWFLSQQGSVKGFKKAIFSGLPTPEIARIIKEYVVPNPNLRGLYHVSAEPINKYELLILVAEVYGKEITIHEASQMQIDRSLDSRRFREKTGYTPPSWRELIQTMCQFQ